MIVLCCMFYVLLQRRPPPRPLDIPVILKCPLPLLVVSQFVNPPNLLVPSPLAFLPGHVQCQGPLQVCDSPPLPLYECVHEYRGTPANTSIHAQYNQKSPQTTTAAKK
ncbi:hypothetical protein BDZ91DRAFT_27241 [Kalaharituber pfeilii]|nr:hypothetical protein BDZ91DRAFT_27241 [Kalaharituber pfeilii]